MSELVRKLLRDAIGPQISNVEGVADAIANIVALGVPVNVQLLGADPTGVASSADAFDAAFALLPASGGAIKVPRGTYRLDRPLVWNGKSVALVGEMLDGATLAITHTGVGLTITPGDVKAQVQVLDLTFAAQNAAAATAIALSVAFPVAVSNARTGFTARNLQFISSPSGQAAQTFVKGIKLVNSWSPRIRDVQMQCQFSLPGVAGSCLLDVGESFDVRLVDAVQYYGETLILQSGYCEGIRISNSTAVGTNWYLKQTLGSIVQRAGLALVGAWLDGGEVNTQLGGVQLAKCKGMLCSTMQWSQWAGVTGGTTYVAYDLTDQASCNSVGDVFIGGANTNTAIRLRNGGGNCTQNSWCSVTTEGAVSVLADIGASCNINLISTGYKVTGTVTDGGVGNRITYTDINGATQGHTY